MALNLPPKTRFAFVCVFYERGRVFINGILDFIAACPLLDRARPLFWDYMDGVCYAVLPVSDIIIKTDVLGNAVRRMDFKFCMRDYTSDDNKRLVNAGFMKSFARWIEQCSRSAVFPDMGGGTEGRSLAMTDAVHAENSEDGLFGTYEMTVRFVYKINAEHIGEKG